MYRIGIDVGGTFTDLVAVDESGEVILAKAASTPSDPSIGVLDGLARLALALGRDLSALLSQAWCDRSGVAPLVCPHGR